MRFFSRTGHVGLATFGLLVLSAASGCNAIFGIEEGILAKGGEGTGAQGGDGGAGAQGGDGGAGAQGGDGGAGAQGGNGGSGGGGPAGGGGAGGGSVCDPKALGPSEALGPDCGIFVDSGAPAGGAGSQASPFKSLAPALAQSAEPKRIYLCGSATYPSDSPLIDSATEVYGGIDCGWKKSADRAQILGPAAAPALRISSATVLLENVEVKAPSNPLPSGPSIGIFSVDGDLTLRDSRVVSGNGGNGADGADPPTPAASGGAGAGATCSLAVGTGGTNPTCPVDTAGGNGAGDDTLCDLEASDPTDGAGTNGGSAGDSFPLCSDGLDGDAGLVGLHGQSANRFGSFAPSGWRASVTTIFPGPGQHGGGGGGGAGCTTDIPAPGTGLGGGGGAGGCGGLPGRSGENGGASFALVLDGGWIVLADALLESGTGGRGGAGKPGQLGGPGGQGGNGSEGMYDGRRGGNGASGGDGGSGSGGDGGPSALVAFRGTAFEITGTAPTAATVGAEGPPGPGGTVAANNAGRSGSRCIAMEFGSGEHLGSCFVMN